MSQLDFDAAQRACSALRNIVIHKFGGWEDRDTLRQVEHLCGAAADAVDDKECRHKLQRFRYYAAELFSEERHRRWARDSLFGSDVLRLEMLELLDAFRARLSRIEAQMLAQLKPGRNGQALLPQERRIE